MVLAWNKEQNVWDLSRAFDESNSNLKGLIDYWFKQDDSEQINGQAVCSSLKYQQWLVRGEPWAVPLPCLPPSLLVVVGGEEEH